MSNDAVAIIFLVIVIAGLFAFFRFGKVMRENYYAKTAADSYRKRVIGRSLVAATFLGWGGIGTEGFGLPAPVLPGLIFGAFHDLVVPSHMGSLFLMNVAAFFICWCIALIIFSIRERSRENH